MKNLEEESVEFKEVDIINAVNAYMAEIDIERKQLYAQISKFEKTIKDAGLKIKKIEYRRKNDTDEYGDERWYRYEFIKKY